MKFFTGKEVSDFVKEKHEKMKQEALSLKLFKNNIEKTMPETKVKRYNQWSRTSSYEPEYYMIDGYCITFVIQFMRESLTYGYVKG